MSTYHLYRWSVIADPYSPPEDRVIHLEGFRDNEYSRVITSQVISVNGREITTSSGSLYILENIEPEYKAYLDSTNDPYDPENPIRIKKV